MAKKAEEKTTESTTPAEVSEKDKARARQWFKKAVDLRERRDYDYAIECYITGLGYWPTAVEDGHMPLRSLAIQRHQAGGKKPSVMDSFKKKMTGKDTVKAMLNAEHLLSMDPYKGTYADGLLKNAAKAQLFDVVKWVAPICFDTMKKDKKPDKARFKTFRQTLIEAAEIADDQGDNAMETWLLEQAVNSLEFLISRNPSDEDLKNEQRDLAGRLTIARGKYDEDGDFRDSLQDAESQKLLHDADRARQGEDTLEALISAMRKEYEAEPDAQKKINAYVDALLKTERKAEEDEAIRVLIDAYERTHNYSLKLRADDIRLRQMTREARQLLKRAKETGDSADAQQYRLTIMELRQETISVFRERVAQYPTDLRLKYKLGVALFDAGEYDEAIPVLQSASNDPRHRAQCQVRIGRAFFEKGNTAQACDVLRETLERHELQDDFQKEMLYWLGRSYEEDGNIDQAKATYGQLLRQDYNYMDGDARKRLDALQSKKQTDSSTQE